MEFHHITWECVRCGMEMELGIIETGTAKFKQVSMICDNCGFQNGYVNPEYRKSEELG